MSIFTNAEEAVSHFFHHTETVVAADVDADVTAGLVYLKPLLNKVVADIKTKGLPVIESAGKIIASSLISVAEGNQTKSQAGNIAISAVKAAGIELSEDTLHALTTAALAAL